MIIWAIDPGPEQSALVLFDGAKVLDHETSDNDAILSRIADRCRSSNERLVIEQVASFGMPVGADVFETVFASGRFAQAWHGYVRPNARVGVFGRLKRHEIKTHLCQNQRAKDPHIRQALLDRFGPGKEKAVGRKLAPGPLFGIVGDEWSALAVAVVWWDTQILKRGVA